MAIKGATGSKAEESRAFTMTTFERHLQTGVQVILLGVVIWVGTSVVELRQDMVRLKERDEYKTQLIEGLRAEITRANESRYRVEDARRDFHRIETDMKVLSNRVDELSRLREEATLRGRTLSNQIEELMRRTEPKR